MSCVLVVAENKHLGYCDLPVSLTKTKVQRVTLSHHLRIQKATSAAVVKTMTVGRTKTKANYHNSEFIHEDSEIL